MNVFKVSEIAQMMGQKPQSINTWAKRGKILIEGGFIDITKEPNKTFLTDKGLIYNHTKDVDANQSEIKAQESKPQHQPILKQRRAADSTESVASAQDINRLKAAKLKEEAKFAKLRNLKIEGELIRTDVVGRATAEVILRYKSLVSQNMEQLIRDLCNENGISNEIRTRMISNMLFSLNAASKRANEESIIAINNSISDSLSING